MKTIPDTASALANGRTTSRDLIDAALARIADPGGEGGRAFVRVYADAARAMADAADAQRRAGRAPGPLAGIPISIKDLFDVAGEPTPAGSKVLADAPPAPAHATVIARALAAGLIPVGRTNMTEFAFSGLGINPHYGTPSSPWDRATGRIPGGSSSGAAVSVSDGMALAGLGTDTGGSCRVPAAMCGITGYKPTARRVPLTGVLPLSRSLDSIGPLANTVACCATIDAVLAGETPVPITPLDVSGLRLAVPENIVFEGADETVLGTFDRALARLEKAGARIIRRRFSGLDDVAIANRTGGFAAPEAFAQHRALLAKRGDGYDPHVRRRIERGGEMHVADYIALAAERIAVITRMNAQTAPYDALVMPTCPLAPPAIAPLEADDEEYRRVNLLQLRNTALGNFLDRCAISLPCHAPGDPPVGFMVMGETMGDAKLFAIAAAIEAAIR
ncbi:MAG TPA: amidase [Acetobacteraceae bacterium]|jgi:aspartyl-tRNA(Asn)/glutamyl-tRNA(Gln) amidotransferase subunit A|nr:amidase [Acetobacteraceae bacterium]